MRDKPRLRFRMTWIGPQIGWAVDVRVNGWTISRMLWDTPQQAMDSISRSILLLWEAQNGEF